MTAIRKLKNPVIIITASFYAGLILIPFLLQQGHADFSQFTAFFLNRNLNILLCIVPLILAVFSAKKDIKNKNLTLASADTLLLFFIYSEFFVSANYFLLLLTAIFMLLFILINVNEFFALAGVIPFFFLNELGMFHYVLIVAIPLIFLLSLRRRYTENKKGKTAITITLFFQCYICIFFTVLVISDLYWLNISTLLPEHITAEYIIKTITALILMLLIAVCFIINKIRQAEKFSEKLLCVFSAIILLSLGITGYFTDIISTVNKSAFLISLIYFVVFDTQYALVKKTENRTTKATEIIAVSSAVLLTFSMII